MINYIFTYFIGEGVTTINQILGPLSFERDKTPSPLAGFNSLACILWREFSSLFYSILIPHSMYTHFTDKIL